MKRFWMTTKLDTLFETAKECKEKTHPCKMSKNSIDKIYKPDNGIKNKLLEKTLFINHPPKLCDCAIVYSKSKLALIEIKCGKVTKSVLKEVIEKLQNTSKLIKHERLNITKYILLYQRFENSELKKKLITQKICGKPLISKKYENQAINI